MNIDTKLKSDDNEFARYLAEYLNDNADKFKSRTSDNGIDRDALYLLIKDFELSLP